MEKKFREMRIGEEFIYWTGKLLVKISEVHAEMKEPPFETYMVLPDDKYKVKKEQ